MAKAYDKKKIPGVLAALISLAGCTVGPNFEPPKLTLPAQFTEHEATPSEVAATNAELKDWWESFNDPVLNNLIGGAIAGNLDLQAATQNLLAARAERDEAAADLYPSIGAVASVDRAFSSETLEYPPGNGNYHDYEVGFDASWELDIFGGTRRTTEAAANIVNATIEARRSLLVSLLSEVASDYAALRATQLLLSIANDNVTDAQQSLTFAQQELSQGLGTDLAALQAQSELQTQQAAIPPLQAKIAVQSHAIAVLLGKDPGSLEAQLQQPGPLMALPADLPGTVPADVIANRPDVHEAESRYAAANAEIGVAIAARLPSFSIPLSITPEASAIHQLFSTASLAFSIALSASQPVYEGGRLNAKVREARANAAAASLNYRQSVLTALQNVEDALVTLQQDRVASTSLNASLQSAQMALHDSTRLYNAGLENFLTVPTDERTVFSARDAVAENQLQMVNDYIALYKAFGGGWQAVKFDN